MVDSYHPFWWWCGCICVPLVERMFITHELQCKRKKRISINMLLIWELAQWREGESQIVFFKRSCSLAHGLCLKFNACNLLKLFNSFTFYFSFCCISEAFGLGWPDLLLWKKKKVAFLLSQPNTISIKKMCHWVENMLWVQRFVEIQVNCKS